MEDMRTLLTAREVADHLGVSVQTISRWVGNNKLRPTKKLPGIRGAYLFDPADVDAVKDAS